MIKIDADSPLGPGESRVLLADAPPTFRAALLDPPHEVKAGLVQTCTIERVDINRNKSNGLVVQVRVRNISQVSIVPKFDMLEAHEIKNGHTGNTLGRLQRDGSWTYDYNAVVDEVALAARAWRNVRRNTQATPPENDIEKELFAEELKRVETDLEKAVALYDEVAG